MEDEFLDDEDDLYSELAYFDFDNLLTEDLISSARYLAFYAKAPLFEFEKWKREQLIRYLKNILNSNLYIYNKFFKG